MIIKPHCNSIPDLYYAHKDNKIVRPRGILKDVRGKILLH